MLQLTEGIDTTQMDGYTKSQGGRVGIGTFRKLFVAASRGFKQPATVTPSHLQGTKMELPRPT